MGIYRKEMDKRVLEQLKDKIQNYLWNKGFENADFIRKNLDKVAGLYVENSIENGGARMQSRPEKPNRPNEIMIDKSFAELDENDNPGPHAAALRRRRQIAFRSGSGGFRAEIRRVGHGVRLPQRSPEDRPELSHQRLLPSRHRRPGTSRGISGNRPETVCEIRQVRGRHGKTPRASAMGPDAQNIARHGETRHPRPHLPRTRGKS